MWSMLLLNIQVLAILKPSLINFNEEIKEMFRSFPLKIPRLAQL